MYPEVFIVAPSFGPDIGFRQPAPVQLAFSILPSESGYNGGHHALPADSFPGDSPHS